MAAIFAFTCSCCEQVHEGSPSFGFAAPTPYTRLTEDEQSRIAELSEDLCVIRHPEGTQYFVRAILEVPIHGVEEPFLWGVWVSASASSFQRYVDSYEHPPEDKGFFGWLSNHIGLYPTDQSRPADVWIQTDGTRPQVVLHRSRDGTDSDALVIDQHQGISIARAQELAEQAMHGQPSQRKTADGS
ncbi:DUF2199 domain-containing protein [Comamonas sp. GB3 AK4-5]|uniref:DUF2199 domain-containing protein n=1 Tax=Comamonas sp. GB3 AK4-5 TaxID=3231487 RepID=UPI00351E15B3